MEALLPVADRLEFATNPKVRLIGVIECGDFLVTTGQQSGNLGFRLSDLVPQRHDAPCQFLLVTLAHTQSGLHVHQRGGELVSLPPCRLQLPVQIGGGGSGPADQRRELRIGRRQCRSKLIGRLQRVVEPRRQSAGVLLPIDRLACFEAFACRLGCRLAERKENRGQRKDGGPAPDDGPPGQ